MQLKAFIQHQDSKKITSHKDKKIIEKPKIYVNL
jgi:hypothetical protein